MHGVIDMFCAIPPLAAARTPARLLRCLLIAAALLAGLRPGARQARADETRPNIVFIMTDDQSPTALGIAGNTQIRTPNMDRLAREGVYFTRAYTPLPQCAPGRATLLSGLYPHQLGVLSNNNATWNPDTPCFSRMLKEAGYQCGFVGKWHLGKPEKPQAGFDDYWVTLDLDAPKQNHYNDPLIWIDGKSTTETGELCEILTTHATKFIDKCGDKPFLLWLNYKEPHVPLVPPASPRFEYDMNQLALPVSVTDDLSTKPAAQRDGFCHAQYRKRDERALKRELATYYAMLTHVDESIGQLLNVLNQKNLTKKTLVIFMSDNGCLVGEHQMVRKGPALYEELVRVPLIFRWPGVLKGSQKREALVSAMDLLPTIAAATGLKSPSGIVGRSFWPVVRGDETTLRDEVFLEYAEKASTEEQQPMAGVVTARFKYARYINGNEEELYDLQADPFEMKNLAKNSESAAQIKTLRGKVDGFLKTVEKPYWTPAAK